SGLDALTSRAFAAQPQTAEAMTGKRAMAKSAGVQTGLALAFLGTKVLGQYEPVGQDGSGGRLLLVAPNIVHAERALHVPAEEVRLWVCLHEAAPRLEFSAVSWLTGYLVDGVGRFIAGIVDGQSNVFSRIPDVIRSARGGTR